jgi:hypothetical protein
VDTESTVGAIASSEPTGGTVRTGSGPDRSPARRRGRRQLRGTHRAPGQWEGFSAYYEWGARRRFVVELREVDTRGMILVPAVFDPGTLELDAG